MVKSSGLTWSTCNSNADCVGSRQCKTPIQNCNGQDVCYCIPKVTKFCLSNANCGPEVCADSKQLLRKLCISKEALNFANFANPGPASTRPGEGFTFSPCANDSQCKGARSCTFFYGNPFSAPCSGRKPCYCVVIVRCLNSAQCPTGEVCANTPLTFAPICVSKKAETNTLSLGKVLLTIQNTAGYGLDPCRKQSDCQGSRRCLRYNRALPLCNSNNNCICVPKDACQTSDDCPKQEVCANSEFFTTTICVSLKARANISGTQAVQRPIVCPVLINRDPPVRMLSMGSSRIDEIPQNVSLHEVLHSDGRMPKELEHPLDLSVPEAVNIVGGQRISRNLQKYMVSLSKATGALYCSGSILSTRWILTAAHCKPRKGDIATFLPRDGSFRSTVIRITRVFSNPLYDITPGDFLGDVAVCELATGVPAGSKFVKLNAKPNLPSGGSLARVLGYGNILTGVPGLLNGMRLLRQVDVRIIPHESCTKVYETDSFVGDPIIERGQICAGSVPRGGCGIW